MKTSSLLPRILSVCFVASLGLTAGAQDSDPVVTSRGPHHRVWTRSTVIQQPNGRTRTNMTSFVELGSGMHRWDTQAGRWVDTDNTIEILPDGSGAASHRGAHQAAFAVNLNTRGAITLHTPDGKRLVSHVLGLAWIDAATGRSEMFASVQDSIGELHGTDTVLYRDAFSGVNAAVRYTNRKGSFEQDVILFESPSIPAGYAPDTTRLEVWTEFLEAPAASLTQRGRAGMTDDTLDFGAMQTGPGRAFLLGEEHRGTRAVVAKRWITTADNRTFLVEAVRYLSAKRDLDRLPARQAAVNPPGNAVGLLANAPQGFGGRQFPPPPKARAQNSTDKFRTASVPAPAGNRRAAAQSDPAAAGAQAKSVGTALNGNPGTAEAALGFVIDYDLQSSLTNFVFQCDTTYYAINAVSLYGTGIVIEGGTVVKFAKTNTAQLNINGTPTWATAQYRPAIFTAKDDNTVGEALGSGSPSGYYGGTYLSFGGTQHGNMSLSRQVDGAERISDHGS